MMVFNPERQAKGGKEHENREGIKVKRSLAQQRAAESLIVLFCSVLFFLLLQKRRRQSKTAASLPTRHLPADVPIDKLACSAGAIWPSSVEIIPDVPAFS